MKTRAMELGFRRCGITDLSATPHGDELKRWLADGMAATMHYMHRQLDRRLEPERILPGATRAVVVTRDYRSTDPPVAAGCGRVAQYARGRDYHTALQQPLAALATYIETIGGEGTVARAYCDAGPVPERELAQRAGIGWIGKNTMLIDPASGSFCFLAAILTTCALSQDLPFEADRCGSCRRCLDACPTNAFPHARTLDSRRCLSYLTIEHVGTVELPVPGAMNDWIFGCDICQDVCPWNVKFAAVVNDPTLGADPNLAQLDLQELLRMSDEEFDRRFGETALTRAGAAGLRRNAQLAKESAATAVTDRSADPQTPTKRQSG